MARVAITEQYLIDIADAIRSKTGSSSATYLPSEMASAIMTISGGGGIIPTGTINITQNGTHDVTNYASAYVQVPTGSTINNQDKTVNPSTSQQTITADSGYTGLGTVTVNAMPAGTAGTPTASKGTVSNNSISVTPSVTNTTGYITGSTKTGTAVTVSASELVSGNKAITSNGNNIDVTNYATVSVNVSGGAPVINSLTVTPSESEQTFNSSSVDGYKPVTVGAISSTYVGSGIARKSSTDLTASGATVSVPAGYYAEAASKSVTTMTLPTSTAAGATSGYTLKATVSRSTSDQYINIAPGYNSAGGYYKINAVANGSASAPSTISGTSATVSTGTNTLTLTKTVSVTPVVSAGYVSSGTATNSSVSLTASVTTKAAATITPGTTNQTIAAGTYLTGAQTISGDANLVAGNIKSGVSIFGILGTYTGGGSSNFTLLGTLSLGTISTSSTSATDTGKSITVKGVYDYDLLVCECSVDSITNNRHAATTRLCWLTASSNVTTKNGATFATATWNCKLSSAGVATTRSGTTAYGIYANGCTVSAGSTGDNGQAVITIYQRYNSTSTGTINGSYTMRVYGVKIYDLIGG